MIADIRIYVHQVIGVWFNTWWVVTAVPEILSYMTDMTPERVTAFLDRVASPHARQRFYRGLFLIGILISGFIAWDEQHHAAMDKTSGIEGRVSRLEGSVNILASSINVLGSNF